MSGEFQGSAGRKGPTGELVAIKVRWPDSTCVDFFTNFELFDLQLLVMHLKLVNWLCQHWGLLIVQEDIRGENTSLRSSTLDNPNNVMIKERKMKNLHGFVISLAWQARVTREW